ncbi:MAG: ABC transporter substrate-binding protein, periplasmic subunit family 3 [Treponematales bacterium]
MKKSLFMLLAAFVAVSAASAKGSPETREEDYVLKIGYGITAGLCSAPFFIAQEKGYYEEEELKYDIVKVDQTQQSELLTTGRLDVVNNLLALIIQPIANGLDIKIPLGIHTGCIKVLVRHGSNIRTPADLKGKRIGTSGMAASGTVITQRYLAELGIGVTSGNLEVEWLIFQTTELPLALERGQVDAIAVGDPTAYIVESQGKGRVIINSATDDYLKNEFCCVLVAASPVVAKYPKTVAKFTRAIQKAAAYVQENPDETARLMKERNYVAGEPEVNAAILKTYNFRASVSEAETAIIRNTRDLQRIGLVDNSVSAEELTRSTFIALDGVPDSLYK